MNDGLSLSATEKAMLDRFSRLEERDKDAWIALVMLRNLEESLKEVQKRLCKSMGLKDINKNSVTAEKILDLISACAEPEKAAEIAITVISSFIEKTKDEALKGDQEQETLKSEELALLATSNDETWKRQDWRVYPSFESVSEEAQAGSKVGYIYVAEFGDYVKIGYSINPKRRLYNHAATAKNYGNIKTGRVLLSPAHENYTATEKLLHDYFKDHRKQGTELFELGFEDVVCGIREVLQGQADEGTK